MTTGSGRLTDQPAWKALEEHHRDIRTVHLRELFARDPRRGERLTAGGRGRLSRLFEEPDHRRHAAAARPPRGGLRPARPHRRHVRRREDQRLGETGRAPRGVARAARRVDPGRRRERRARGSCRARPDGGLRESRPQRRVDRPHRQADPQRRQHRHRRLRPRAGHGLRGAQALQRPQPHLPLRLEHRRHRLRRSGPRSRPGGDALHRVVQDLHDARDDDQRPHRARVVAGGRRRRRGVGRQALRRGLDQRRGSRRSSASTPPTCSGSGTGSAGATPWSRRSASRRCWRSARITSAPCSTASTRWTSTSAPRPSRRTCRCSWGSWASGTPTSSGRTRSRCCRTSSTSSASPPTSSS